MMSLQFLMIFNATKETYGDSIVGHVPQPLGIYSGVAYKEV